jgi:hypothetical protein
VGRGCGWVAEWLRRAGGGAGAGAGAGAFATRQPAGRAPGHLGRPPQKKNTGLLGPALAWFLVLSSWCSSVLWRLAPPPLALHRPPAPAPPEARPDPLAPGPLAPCWGPLPSPLRSSQAWGFPSWQCSQCQRWLAPRCCLAPYAIAPVANIMSTAFIHEDFSNGLFARYMLMGSMLSSTSVNALESVVTSSLQEIVSTRVSTVY